jgi:hypothetical protein
MSYESFLMVTSQLAGSRKARAVIDGEVVFFDASEKKNRWTLYTKVFCGDGYLPKDVRACVSSSGVLRWQQMGAYLKLDPLTHSVYLFQDVEMEEGKYIPFKHNVDHFCMVANEWRDILKGFADNDCSFV